MQVVEAEEEAVEEEAEEATQMMFPRDPKVSRHPTLRQSATRGGHRPRKKK